MLSRSARAVLDTALGKYRPGRTDLISVGGITRLKPALRLMTYYRLMIQEVTGTEIVISYTRWLEAVIVKGTENQEVYVTFSPQFERIWLETKKRLSGMFPENRPISNSGVNLALILGMPAGLRLHLKISDLDHS